MADLEAEIRRAFERRLAAMPPRPHLRARISDAVARGSRPQAWRVVAASAALLLVGAVTFSVLLARHGQPRPIVGPTPSAHASPTPSALGSACLPPSPAAYPAPMVRLGGAITTVAGGGVTADVPSPYAVAVNIDGVIYIGDGTGLQRVGTDGSITTNDQYGTVPASPLAASLRQPTICSTRRSSPKTSWSAYIARINRTSARRSSLAVSRVQSELWRHSRPVSSTSRRARATAC
jgi:hypothetical protein